MLRVHDKFHSFYASQFIKPWVGEQSQNVGPNKMRGHHIWLLLIIRFMIWQGKLAGHITLKTHAQELYDLGILQLPLGSKDELQRSFGRTQCGLDHWIWTRDAKYMASRSSQSHCPKKEVTKHFFFLCSSNGNSINEHLCIDKCHKFILSPNNLMFKLIMFIEKTKHFYLRVEIKTLKKGNTMFGYQILKVC